MSWDYVKLNNFLENHGIKLIDSNLRIIVARLNNKESYQLGGSKNDYLSKCDKKTLISVIGLLLSPSWREAKRYLE